MCRFRRELSNAYFVAKVGLDTAENEPYQVCPTEQCSSPSAQSRHLEPDPERAVGAVAVVSVRLLLVELAAVRVHLGGI